MRLLPKLLNRAVKAGRMTLRGPEDFEIEIGGQAPGPECAIRILDKSLDWKIALNPELKAAEAYMDGGIDIAPEDLREVLRLFKLNQGRLKKTTSQSPFRSMAKVVKKVIKNNPIVINAPTNTSRIAL